jgi:Cell wall-active antibiotics response 4TMS YvqF/Domain of unknown function (DUF1707)
MPDVPVQSLARARELKINELSNHFANDDLTLEELERRIEQVYKAASVAELETITADLKSAAVVPPEFVRAKVVKGQGDVPATYELPRGRILSFMSSMRKVGRWAVPRELDLRAIMSDTKVDLTQAVLSDPMVVVEVRAVMASLRIVVPPGMRVVVETSSIMSNVLSRADDYTPSDRPATPEAPVVRLTGYAFMSDVQVFVRRREDARIEDAEDDDD